MNFSVAFLLSLLASFGASILIVCTKHLHGHLTLDSHAGVQKLHKVPTPRVGGVALLFGAITGGIYLPSEVLLLWSMICIAVSPAFVFGLIEDITKRVGVKTRLAATLCAGVIFSMLTGYRVTEMDIPGLDWLFSFWLPSLIFTAFAIGGSANAINLIDGVNGLASGTAIIILSCFAIVAWQVGDAEIVGVCLVSLGAVIGFFLVNFPMGRLFLGDAGAYTIGFILAVVAIALPQRNLELSPLLGLLALSYPMMETIVSIQRRIVRQGTNPGQPDRLHLHSLIYRSRAKRLANKLGAPQLRNALTGVLLMGLPIMSSVLTIIYQGNSAAIGVSFAFVQLVYVLSYRKVALLRRVAPLSRERHQV